MSTYNVQKNAELLNRKTLSVQPENVNLFNMSHGLNYLTALLMGSAPKSKGAPDIYDQITAHFPHNSALTPGLNRGSKKSKKTGKVSYSPKKDRRTHTRKENKGSSSSHLGQKYNSHLVDDMLQSAFLYYWENRAEKEYLNVQERDNKDNGKTIEENARARITRFACRHVLFHHFSDISVERENLKKIHGSRKDYFSTVEGSIFSDSQDMLQAEKTCDNVASLLANGNKRLERIVRLTMGKTNKKKCLARALRCSRPTLDARLDEIIQADKCGAAQWSSEKRNVSKKIGTLASVPHTMKKASPIESAPSSFLPVHVATVPVATVPVATVPVALSLGQARNMEYKQAREQARKDIFRAANKCEYIPVASRGKEYEVLPLLRTSNE